jgi:hypothetical protein
MAPGHHALDVKIKSIEEEVELKINFAVEFRADGAVRNIEPVRDHTVGQLEESDEDS